MKYYNERIALHRGAEPEELAATIAYLLSDDASYVTCATLLARRLHRDRGAVGARADRGLTRNTGMFGR